LRAGGFSIAMTFCTADLEIIRNMISLLMISRLIEPPRFFSVSVLHFLRRFIFTTAAAIEQISMPLKFLSAISPPFRHFVFHRSASRLTQMPPK
jgi:hypothetical protein